MKKPKKFGDSDFLPTFALANENHAEIAQLVERNLAKVEVAGPSPVFRSRVAKERRIARFSFLFFGGGRDSTPATSRRPFQGPGVSTTDRGRSRAARVRVPFSAPEWQRKGESQDSPFCFSRGGAGFDACDLKAPLSGAGGVDNESRPLARSASASPVFRSRGGQKETPIEGINPRISAIYGDLSFILSLLLTQKATRISRLNRDLFCPDRKQVAI